MMCEARNATNSFEAQLNKPKPRKTGERDAVVTFPLGSDTKGWTLLLHSGIKVSGCSQGTWCHIIYDRLESSRQISLLSNNLVVYS